MKMKMFTIGRGILSSRCSRKCAFRELNFFTDSFDVIYKKVGFLTFYLQHKFLDYVKCVFELSKIPSFDLYFYDFKQLRHFFVSQFFFVYCNTFTDNLFNCFLNSRIFEIVQNHAPVI